MKQKAVNAYTYNDKVFLAKNTSSNSSFKADFEEKVFIKTMNLIEKIAIESIKKTNNPLISLKGDFASLLTKVILESNMEEKEKINLIYELELNTSYNEFKEMNFNSEEKILFYNTAQKLNNKIKDILCLKENKELSMLLDNILNQQEF